MEILSILFPVVSIVLLGYGYARKYRPDMDVANGLVLRVFVPALVFDVVSGGDFQLVSYRWLALGSAIVVVASGFVAWGVGRAFKYPNTIIPVNKAKPRAVSIILIFSIILLLGVC